MPKKNAFRNHSFNLSVCSLLVLLTVSVCRGQSVPSLLPAFLAPQPPISVTSTLVVLPVRVTDDQGNSIFGLAEKDFRVYDEKQPQKLALFEQDDAPVSVGLIVDHSASMRTKLPRVINAVSAFVATSNPKDEMFAVNFNDRISIAPKQNFTNDPEVIEQALGSIAPTGRTALYDAVAQGLLRLQTGRWPKKALIVVSDGGDNASSYNKTELITLARKSQVSIYSIVLTDNVGDDQNPKALRQLAKETGGAAFAPQIPEKVMDMFSVIARDLREQYIIG